MRSKLVTMALYVASCFYGLCAAWEVLCAIGLTPDLRLSPFFLGATFSIIAAACMYRAIRYHRYYRVVWAIRPRLMEDEFPFHPESRP